VQRCDFLDTTALEVSALSFAVLFLGASLAWAQPCGDGETIVLRLADHTSAPAYRPAIRSALLSLRDEDDCPLFTPEVGVLDWVDIEALAQKEGEIRKLFRVLEGVATADAATRKQMAEAIRTHTSGYGDATQEYLARFSQARAHMTVSQARGEGWTNVYIELRRAQELLPVTSAFTFDAADPAERNERVKAAVLELFPQSNHAPELSLVGRQDTGHGVSLQTAAVWDPDQRAPEDIPTIRVQEGVPVQFDAGTTRDPETALSSLNLAWTLDGLPAQPERATLLEHTFSGRETHEVGLQVSDGALQREARLRVEVADPVQLHSATAAVQVLGVWRGVSRPLSFDVDEPPARPELDDIRYTWIQTEGPSLTCIDVQPDPAGVREASCEDTGGLRVQTVHPRLQMGSSIPGAYRFSMFEVADAVASAPIEVATEAVYTRTSVIQNRVDFASAVSVAGFKGLDQANLTIEVGLPGLRIGTGIALTTIRMPDPIVLRYSVLAGGTIRLRDLITYAIEQVRNDPDPLGTYMVAWSPSVDIYISSWVNTITLLNNEAPVKPFSVTTTSAGPQVNVGPLYFVPAMTIAILRQSEFELYGLARQQLGATFHVGLTNNYASGRTFYPPTLERIDSLAAFSRAKRAKRRERREERRSAPKGQSAE